MFAFFGLQTALVHPFFLALHGKFVFQFPILLLQRKFFLSFAFFTFHALYLGLVAEHIPARGACGAAFLRPFSGLQPTFCGALFGLQTLRFQFLFAFHALLQPMGLALGADLCGFHAGIGGGILRFRLFCYRLLGRLRGRPVLPFPFDARYFLCTARRIYADFPIVFLLFHNLYPPLKWQTRVCR